MEDWQQRVIEEEKELGEKINKLMYFLESEKFLELPFQDKSTLWKQFYGMIDYRAALQERIARFSR